MKGQGHLGQRSNLWVFSICSPTSPRSLGRSSPNLVGRLRAAPDIARGVHLLKVKVIEVKGQISVSPRSLGRISPNLEGWWRAATDIGLRVHFLKGQGHRGQRSNLCFFLFVPLLLRSLGRSSPNLVGRLRAAPDISSSGSFIKGQGHRGQRSNFCISQVLGPNFTKLGGMVEGGPRYWLEGLIF